MPAFPPAMCKSELRRWFKTTYELVQLEMGDPFPLPNRPTHTAVNNATPYPPGLDRTQLLARTDFRLFRSPASHRLSVQLDFSNRDSLDNVMWVGDESSGRFPIIATVHPYGDADDLTIDGLDDPDNPAWWFGVRPRDWDEDGVLELLDNARRHGAGVAVLPELALPNSTALTTALASNPHLYPRLIVAGSAHVRTTAIDDPERELRANETWVYLDGRPILRHRKIQPFETRFLPPDLEFTAPLPEGITHEPKVLTLAAGTITRLGVVICADLNDSEIPALLQQLGVNLLLVPALTVHDGAFNGAVALLASQAQAVSVVANGTPYIRPSRVRGDDPEQPFLVLVGVPRTKPQQQTASLTSSSGQRRALGIVDPNKPAHRSTTWPTI